MDVSGDTAYVTAIVSLRRSDLFGHDRSCDGVNIESIGMV
jgi:hypothetical protein